jgi:hypothetical protein
MWRVFGGGVLLVGGIAAFIEERSHRPLPPGYLGRGLAGAPARLSENAYDLVRIGGWALIVIGGLLVAVGLIGYWAAQTRRSGRSRGPAWELPSPRSLAPADEERG